MWIFCASSFFSFSRTKYLEWKHKDKVSSEGGADPRAPSCDPRLTLNKSL